MTAPTKGLELRSLVYDGKIELSLVDVELSPPGPGEVIVRIEAAPLNPSDLGLLTGPADLATLDQRGTADRPVLTAEIPPQRMPMVRARLNESMPVGNEGAGTVVAAGDGAEELIGKTVAVIGGGMYTQYRKARLSDLLPFPDGVTAREGASAFVNPLTALAMVETMRAEGHSALVHTAAASNLGQMLNRICIADGVSLVNIVRSAEQARILHDIGAKYVVDSTSDNFRDELVDALAETGATLAFDAIGGGKLAGQILAAMEVAANRNATTYSRYGSNTHKQVYVYGRLDLGATLIGPDVGFAWGVGGFLLTPFLMKAGAEVVGRMRARVAAEIRTTFASHYTADISLAEALDKDTLLAYSAKKTGEKYLIVPTASG
ncbi:zinc-binding dehydrogenase [Sphingomonas asaccharolytica]|uniref:zinc-binding dehydrogenase n=1 Tax=Sphingomonas asaccharolytica TaxID=40681 RepID=UPI0008302A21|nr:zinc-binding dehydrogenase [Sphingomonas asaccharolytica]